MMGGGEGFDGGINLCFRQAELFRGTQNKTLQSSVLTLPSTSIYIG